MARTRVKKKFLKAEEENKTHTWRETRIKMTVNMSSGVMQKRVEKSLSLKKKRIKRKPCQPRILYPVKISSKGRRNRFLVNQFPIAVVPNFQKLGDLTHRNLFSCSSEDQKFKIKCQPGSIPS